MWLTSTPLFTPLGGPSRPCLSSSPALGGRSSAGFERPAPRTNDLCSGYRTARLLGRWWHCDLGAGWLDRPGPRAPTPVLPLRLGPRRANSQLGRFIVRFQRFPLSSTFPNSWRPGAAWPFTPRAPRIYREAVIDASQSRDRSYLCIALSTRDAHSGLFSSLAFNNLLWRFH